MIPRVVPSDHNLVVVDPDEAAREVLQGRLQAQGYRVFGTASAADAASEALAAPPSAVVARLWMPSISGVQLCQLLRAEAATAHVPLILLGDGYSPRGRFCAEQSGAIYAESGAMGDLLRTIARAIHHAPAGDGFFTMLGGVDVRDRIAAELDRRLLESLLAAEVRALAANESFDRLFDQLSQLMCRQCPYGWLALASSSGQRVGVHAHPSSVEAAVTAARAALDAIGSAVVSVVDEDARPPQPDDRVRTREVRFGTTRIGHLAISAQASDRQVDDVLALVASELGLPLRVATLVEATREQALYDPLTSVMNRRAFIDHMSMPGVSRLPYVLCILDVDHFKAVNDRLGHAGGDLVLRELGALLAAHSRAQRGAACRWGGEEFLFVAPGRPADGGLSVGESLRRKVEELELESQDGVPFTVSVSVGVAVGEVGDPLLQVVNRADELLYQAKSGGRNQVCAA